MAPLPASRLAASLRRAPTRGGADPDGPGRASVPGPFPCPGPFRALSAPLRAALPCPPGGSGSLGRGSGAPPPLRPHPPVAGPPPTRGGEEEEELRPAGSGRGCALPGSPPGGRRGGCRRPSVTARLVPRPRGIAGAAAATEGRGAHVGPAPRSPTLSRRRPAAQGPTARCGARQHAAVAGLRAAAER